MRYSEKKELQESHLNHIVVPYYYDQLMRQFGTIQGVPRPIPCYVHLVRYYQRPSSIHQPLAIDIKDSDVDDIEDIGIPSNVTYSRMIQDYIKQWSLLGSRPLFP